MATQVADDMAGSGQPKAAFLLIVGEPFSDSSKQQILEEIVKGLKRWDSEATGVDIDGELAQMAARADLGEEHPSGERVVHYRSDKLTVELLINAQALTVKESLKVLLTSPCPAKAIVYAGYVFQGTAAWVMQDDLFSASMFCQAFKDTNVENALKRVEGGSLMLSTLRGCDWSAALKGSEVNTLLKVSVNPATKTGDKDQGLAQFSAYLGNVVKVTPLTSMLQASDVIGNISFSRPVLYIFPSYQGDAALFGMKGFNMLVDGGYSRRPCFWDFVRHLDGIDALLLTHLGADNLFGLKALLERKVMDSVHPDIDYMYMNAAKMASNGVKVITQGETGGSELVINLAAEGSALVDLSRKLGHAPHALTRPLSSSLEPVNLFHKIGKGSLDMYILNPVADAKETKEFLAEWGKQATSFSQANGIPIPNCSSICALLVVRPASSMEKVTRILFPGTAPQHKLLEGLERVKHLEFLKHPTFCAHDLHKAKKSAAGLTNGRASSVTRRTISSSATRSATRAEPPRHLDTKGASPRTNLTSPASGRASKSQKDTSNKRVSGVTKDKDKTKHEGKEKEDKPKSSTSSSPSKASIKTISPVKSPSPARTPASTSPEERPQEKSKAPAPKPSVEDKPSAVPKDVDQHITPVESPATLSTPPAKVEAPSSEDNRLAASPEALPTPDHFESDVDFGRQQQPPSTLITEQAKLRELGIYDNDDDDEGVDNRFDEKENGGGIFGARDFTEEEVQPQALPEPVAVLETPTSSEPDLMPDTFSKPSLMEQSQLFEHGIEPDYTTESQVSVTESQLEDTTEKETGIVSMSEPQDVDSSMLTGRSEEPAPSVDQFQTLDSAVSDDHSEDSLLAEQQAPESFPPSQPLPEKAAESFPMSEPLPEKAPESFRMSEPLPEKASESFPMSEPLPEKAAESPLMAQDLPEDTFPAAEPEVEKASFDDEPPAEPTNLMQESMVQDSALLAQSQMGDFASSPSSFPAESDVLKQAPEDEQLLAGGKESIPPVSAPKLEDDQGPVSSEYPEAPKEIAPPSDFREEPEPGVSDDEIKEAPFQSDLKEDMTPEVSDEEEAEPTPAPASFDGLREPSPMTGESPLSASEIELEHSPQYTDHHDDIETDQRLTSSCLGSLQASSAPEQPEFSNSLHGHDMQDDFGTSPREPSPALQESDPEDQVKELQSALEEPSFEDSLKEASPLTDGGSYFQDSLREPSPPAQQASSDLSTASTAALEPSSEELREISPSVEEAGFDLKEREAGQTVEESGLDFKEREASPALEEPGFGLKEKEMSPPLEKEDFATEERDASPVPKEQDFEKEESPALEEPGFDMETKEVSPKLEEPGFEMKETEERQTIAEQGYEVEEKEGSPVQDRTNVDDIMENDFDPLKEREVSPALEQGKEASPASEELGYDEGKESSPALKEPDYDLGKEASPALVEPGYDEKEEPSYDEEKEASPAPEEMGYDDRKETSPALAEPGYDLGKETSPALEEPSYDLGKEASPALAEPGYDLGKEASPALAEPGYDLGKEASPALVEPGYDLGKETSPALVEPGYDLGKEASPAPEEMGYDDGKETSPALAEPGYDLGKEASPALVEPGYDLGKEASPALEEPGYDLGKEASPALEEPGYDLGKEASPALAEPGYDLGKEASPALEEPGYDLGKEASPALEEPGYDLGKEASPALVEPGYDLGKEASPAIEEPICDERKEPSPALEKHSFDEKEASPALEEHGYDLGKEASPPLDEPNFDARDREESPALEEYQNYDDLKGLSAPPTETSSGDHAQVTPETHFTGKEDHASALGSDNTEQTQQYGQATDQGLELDDSEAEDEQVLVGKEEIVKKEVTELKQDVGVRREEEEEDDELDADDKAQADMMTRQTMEDMDVSDDDGQDDDEETAEAVDSGDNDNDDFVYEKEVNLTDEERAMIGASSASKEQIMDTEQQDTKPKQDQQTSDIPEASAQTQHTPVKEEYEMPEKGGEVERRLPESYGMEGDLMDGDRDMQEIMAMQQTHHQADLAQEEDSDLDSQDPEPRDDPALNPFGGLEHPPGEAYPETAQSYDEDEGHRQSSGEFDPLAQWGPPTGLPAPATQLDDVDAIPEPVSDSESLKPEEFASCHSTFGEQTISSPEHDDESLGVLGRSESLAQGDFAGNGPFEKGVPAPDKSSEVDATEFDPLAEWGQPMGLPAPTPPENSNKNTSAKKGAGDAKKTDAKKSTSTTKAKTGSEKRPASATKPSPKAMNGAGETPKSARSKPEAKKGVQDTPRHTRPASGKSLDTSRTDTKTRTTPTTSTPRRPARSRASPEVHKMPPLPPFTPFYMDLTYIPNHGDTAYVDGEFFKRVRARYYVLSSRNPNPKILEMLMDAKESWGKATDQEVTVIPTYETQILQHWMAINKEKLAENKIDIAPAASRCTVRLQDHEDSCYTYRLEF